MIVLAIDPGTVSSAFVLFETSKKKIYEKGIFDNCDLRDFLKMFRKTKTDVLVIEQIKSYGMPIGDTTITTCVWIGRFIEAWSHEYTLLPRKTVCSILCHNARANDSHIRQRLIDLFGPSREKAIGKKALPGPLYEIKRDMWSALAVAVAWDIKREGEEFLT